MLRKDTICVHPSRCQKLPYGAIATPIFQSATFVHEGVETESMYSYSRLQNPTRAALESRVAEMEGGEDAIAFATGMAAETTLMNLFESSGHIIAGDDLYGGTLRLFRHISTPSGLRFDFVNMESAENVREKLQQDTKAVYVETPSNPTMQVTDIAAVAEIAHSAGALLIVDNTFLSPYFQRPLELGADIVVHSGTKYAEKIANWLRQRPEVKKVYYIGFPDHPGYAVTKRQCTGFGGMLSMEVDSPEIARKILRSVKLFQYAESLGGVDSLVTYPMCQTHADVPEDERLRRGINDRFLRFSIGIENADDLIEDLRQALENK